MVLSPQRQGSCPSPDFGLISEPSLGVRFWSPSFQIDAYIPFINNTYFRTSMPCEILTGSRCFRSQREGFRPGFPKMDTGAPVVIPRKEYIDRIIVLKHSGRAFGNSPALKGGHGHAQHRYHRHRVDDPADRPGDHRLRRPVGRRRQRPSEHGHAPRARRCSRPRPRSRKDEHCI